MQNIAHLKLLERLISLVIERIKEIREKSGLSQTNFAAEMGVSRRTQASYEAGESKPSTDYLQRIAAAGYDVNYLLTGERRGAILSAEESELLSIWHNASITLRNAALNVLLSGSTTPPSGHSQHNSGGVNTQNIGGEHSTTHHHDGSKKGVNSIGNISGSTIGSISQSSKND